MSPRTAPRHRSREAALQVLYARDLAAAASDSVEERFERVASHFELPPGARAFAQELVSGVVAHAEEIDEILATHATNWRLSRMAAVDRNILRLAVFELSRSTTPTGVVLDEAIELARRFGGDRSPAFVNGVLDAVARSVRPGGDRPDADCEKSA